MQEKILSKLGNVILNLKRIGGEDGELGNEVEEITQSQKQK